MERYFTADEYITPADTPRFLLDKMVFNTRVYLMWRFVKQGLASRKKVRAGIYHREQWAAASFDIFKSIEGCGGRFHITGLNNLLEIKQPVVFVCNHMSTLETVVLPCMIAPLMEMTFVVKESLLRAPIFGEVIGSQNPIVVGRANPRNDLQKVLTEGQALLEKGTSITIFPQSTRTTRFIPEEFNSLGVKLAKRVDGAIVPVALKTDFWENGKYLKDLGPIFRNRTIHFAFGKPIKIEGNGRDAHHRAVTFIQEHLTNWSVN
ncbi:lysophospholipid acyltransferase family protein [Alkaliphilus crotonatoxidans]